MSEDLALLQTLVAIAWADGRVDPAERGLLDALVESSSLSETERATLEAFAAEPRSLDDAPLGALGPEARREVLERAVVLALIDGHEHPDERAMVTELASRLALPDTEGALARGVERARRLRELL